MRCIANVLRVPEIQDFVAQSSNLSGCEVIYSDDVAELDDLDVVDRLTAMAEGYDPEGYRYHCGSLWARREQDLTVFWDTIVPMTSNIGSIIPVLFCRDTISNDLFD